METAQLLYRVQAGEPEAIEDFIWAFQNRVFRLALSILDEPQEAEEAAQDVFIAALAGLPGYRGQAAVHTWLYAITVNICLNRKRRWARVGRLLGRLREALRGDPQAAAGLEQAALRHETSAAVWTAIQSLGERHRLPVILRYYHDLSVAEIAAVLKLREGTVHSRLNTARRRLKGMLADVEL
jgi:RNA polymerase sigma-70 factor, ECF subfamily